MIEVNFVRGGGEGCFILYRSNKVRQFHGCI